jgi:pSer/pThr/pTyr-binding forkhead associated (FHA) protein
MWILVVSDANKGRNSQYILRCDSNFELTIGRTIENTISFPDDKSISRSHAILKHDRSADGVSSFYIIDLRSKYGTVMNKEKLTAEANIRIPESGATIKVGASTARIVITQKTWRFCTSRLEKESKEVLNRRLTILGATTVNAVEDAHYLVMNEYTATLKSLTAIAMKIPMIKVSWLDFVELNSHFMSEIPECSK